MRPFHTPQRKNGGYSLIEMLVVVAIVGVLAIVGVTMIGDRQAGAVRAVMDEVEGALSNAHKAAVASGRDVAIVTWGTWDIGTPLRLAHGDASLSTLNITTTANNLLVGTPPASGLGSAGQTVAVPFRLLPGDAIQMRARVVAIGSAQWTNVMTATSAGTTNQNLTSVDPFLVTEPMYDLVKDANNLFTFSATVANKVLISGSNKRFASTFIIPVVGTTTSGSAIPGGPMGLIVVLGNGGSIYKFYNPGIRNSDGKWRRL